MKNLLVFRRRVVLSSSTAVSLGIMAFTSFGVLSACSGDGATVGMGGDDAQGSGGASAGDGGSGNGSDGGGSDGAGGNGGSDGAGGNGAGGSGGSGDGGTGGTTGDGPVLGRIQLEERTDTTTFNGWLYKAERELSGCQTQYQAGACQVTKTPSDCMLTDVPGTYGGGTIQLAYGMVDQSVPYQSGRYLADPAALTPGQTVSITAAGDEVAAFDVDVASFGSVVKAPTLPKLNKDGIDVTWDVSDGAQGTALLTLRAGGDGADFVRVECSVAATAEKLEIPSKVMGEFSTYASASFWWVTSEVVQTTANGEPYGIDARVMIEELRENLTP